MLTLTGKIVKLDTFAGTSAGGYAYNFTKARVLSEETGDVYEVTLSDTLAASANRGDLVEYVIEAGEVAGKRGAVYLTATAEAALLERAA